MTTVLCTLYNSLYLDKGLVLYDSLCEYANDFKLYVLCMDDKCYEVLTDLKQKHHIPVRLSDFEEGDEALLAAKANRPMGEYCWTCSSSFIRYVLKHYNEDSCTYIDADMYFYNDPQVLINEMLEAGKSVMVVPHRFPEEKKDLAKKVGTYCVEFNTFLNTPESMEVLEYWRGRCLECCSNLGDGVHWGDQKYLEELVEKFDCVHVCENPGAGVAPWNVESYSLNTDSKLFSSPLSIDFDLVFVHYQGISYITNNLVSTGFRKRPRSNKRFVKVFCRSYLKNLKYKKQILANEYGVSTLITKHPTSKRRLGGLNNPKIRSFVVFFWRLFFSKVIMERI